MQFELDQGIDILRRSPAILREMLHGLDDRWTMSNYGPDTFSPYDVMGHLVYGERSDWLGRAKIILEHGESRAFDQFDRYAMYEDSKGKTIGDLLEEFARLRAANLEELASLGISEADYARPGRHPNFGPVNLGQLLATWAVHDLHHIAQICKAMSYQYKEAIGPWLQFIGIVPR